MLEVIGKVNVWFFGEEEISVSDMLWFYGLPVFVTFVMLIVLMGGN